MLAATGQKPRLAPIEDKQVIVSEGLCHTFPGHGAPTAPAGLSSELPHVHRMYGSVSPSGWSLRYTERLRYLIRGLCVEALCARTIAGRQAYALDTANEEKFGATQGTFLRVSIGRCKST